MASKTPWQDSRMPRFNKPAIRKGKHDVLVVGGGITGLISAYLLTLAGKKVCLVERDRLGHGDTGCTTAHLTAVTDKRLSQLVKTFGREGARLAWHGGAAAINTIEHIVHSEKIKCDFKRVTGLLHAAWDGKSDESADLQKDCDLAKEFGFSAEFLDSVPQVDRPGILFENQARFHPWRYLAGIARATAREGGQIFEESEATEFPEEGVAVVKGKRIEFEHLIIATHVPLMGHAGLLGATLFQTKIVPYSSYAIGATLSNSHWPEGLYWDTSDPYFYLRIDHGDPHDYIIFGGMDHKTGQVSDPDERFSGLKEKLGKIIPEARFDRQWSAQVIETHDGLPYIGETAPHQFAATGFSGNGMTFGTLAGMMACDYVLGQKNPWQDLFDVNRKKLAGGWSYLTENFSYPYYLVRDRLSGSEVASVDEIPNGSGKVLKVDGKWIACSRDDEGKLTAVSAVCTHMGCLVHWNNAEGTWDCPCHGSRFQAAGDVLAGPAETALEKVSTPESAAVHSRK